MCIKGSSRGVSGSGHVRRGAVRHCEPLVKHLKHNIWRQRADSKNRRRGIRLVDYSPVNVGLPVKASDTYVMAGRLLRLARAVPATQRRERLVAGAACTAFFWTSMFVDLLPGLPPVPMTSRYRDQLSRALVRSAENGEQIVNTSIQAVSQRSLLSDAAQANLTKCSKALVCHLDAVVDNVPAALSALPRGANRPKGSLRSAITK